MTITIYKIQLGVLIGEEKPREFVVTSEEAYTETEVPKRLMELTGEYSEKWLQALLSTPEKPTTLILDDNRGWRLIKENYDLDIDNKTKELEVVINSPEELEQYLEANDIDL